MSDFMNVCWHYLHRVFISVVLIPISFLGVCAVLLTRLIFEESDGELITFSFSVSLSLL
jgi:hypothetical protein